MKWYAVHGRPVYDEEEQLRGLSPVFSEVHFLADDQPAAIRIMDAIAEQVVAQYGQPIAAYMDVEK